MHVVIASQDFTVFSHIHPEDFGPITTHMKKTAQYPVHYIFPKSGHYIVGINLAVKDQSYSKHFVISVAGTPEMGVPVKDFSRRKSWGLRSNINHGAGRHHRREGNNTHLSIQ